MLTRRHYSFLIFATIILLGIQCDERNSPTIFNMSISITPDGAGTVIPSQDLSLPENETIQILAQPSNPYAFTGWTGSISSNENPLTVTVTENIDLTANFLIKNYPLTVSTVGSGTVIESIITSKTDYDHGTIVQLQAIAEDGWIFSGWSGAYSSDQDIIEITVESELSITATFVIDKVEPVPLTKTNDMKIFVHYMPWFQSAPYDGFWGTHWTMSNRNPNNIIDGQRDIASHFYPLIGPYSSKDPDVAEYHLLLMKYAGIDGIFIDWYGTYDVNDYRLNLEGSENIIDLIDEVGLEFGIVYEDQTTAQVVNAGEASTTIEAATNDWQYIQNNYFSNPNYARVDGNPLALVWTPIEIESGAAWSQILADIDPNLMLLALWYQVGDLGSAGDGEYGWVYGGNGNHLQEIINFYNNRLNRYDLGIGTAYPGFVDFYEEGGQGDVIGWEIPHSTLELTLDLATQYNVDYLQLVTWNDFGEGTIFEPTVETGYTYLETVQTFAGVSPDSDVIGHFETIYDLYQARKEYADTESIQEQLDLAFNYLVVLQPTKAQNILQNLNK